MTPSLFWMLIIEVLVVPWWAVVFFTDGQFNDGIHSLGVGLSCLFSLVFVCYLSVLRLLVERRRVK